AERGQSSARSAAPATRDTAQTTPSSPSSSPFPETPTSSSGIRENIAPRPKSFRCPETEAQSAGSYKYSLAYPEKCCSLVSKIAESSSSILPSPAPHTSHRARKLTQNPPPTPPPRPAA